MNSRKFVNTYKNKTKRIVFDIAICNNINECLDENN